MKTHLATAGDPEGMPLLLLHGTGPGTTGYASFSPLLDGLAKFRCLMPDLIGFGDSSHPTDIAAGPGPWLRRRVQAVRELLDDLGIRNAHVLGHSYGARVALELLKLEPARFDRVVLVAAGGTPVAPNLGRLKGFYENPTEDGLRELLETQMAPAMVGALGDYVPRRLAVAIRPDVRRSFEAAMGAGEAAPINDAAVLSDVKHRVLAVHGRADHVIPSAASIYLAEHLPHGDVHVFADAGHLLQFEMPAAVSTLLRGFLQK